MSDGQTHFTMVEGVATVVFDRPEARNAMTWSMYEGLARACHEIAENPAVRVAVFRGAGGDAFVAGTDIAQFKGYTGEDGLRYEAHIDTAISRMESLGKPTIAVVEGWCTGGGLIMASACDFRIATPSAKFGVPIARTLGNCISVVNAARLVSAFGTARAKRMLLLAEMVAVEDAATLGYVHTIAAPADLDRTVMAMCARLKDHAPLTMQTSKEAIRRVLLNNLPDDKDLVRLCYGSADFQEGITAFLGKRKPNWTGT